MQYLPDEPYRRACPNLPEFERKERPTAELLRGPVWNGISAIVAFVSLIVAIWVERARLRSIHHRIFIAVTNLIVGVLILSVGFIVQPMIWFTLHYGIVGAQAALTMYGSEPFNLLMIGLLPGTVTAAIAASGNTLALKVRRGSIAAIVTLIIWDLAHILPSNAVPETLWFSMLSDVIGGILAGIIVGFAIDMVSKRFGTSE